MITHDSLAGSFRFALSIEGHPLLDNPLFGGFTEASGLEATVKYETVQEGGHNGSAIYLPQTTSYTTLKLSRGIMSPELFDWVLEYRDTGKVSKKNITVSLLGRSGNPLVPVREWHFDNAYPIKWTGPTLKSDTAAIAMETVEFVHEGIRRGKLNELAEAKELGMHAIHKLAEQF